MHRGKTLWGHREKVAVCKPRKRPLKKLDLSTLDLGFVPSRAEKIHCCLGSLVPTCLRYFVMGAHVLLRTPEDVLSSARGWARAERLKVPRSLKTLSWCRQSGRKLPCLWISCFMRWCVYSLLKTGQCLILNNFLMCVFCQKERHKQKIKIITTLISLVLMYYHLEDTQVHEIPISEHCAKKWPLTRVFESLWSFCRESSQCPPGCTVLSFWPRCGEKGGDSELEASAAETQTRSVNAGVWIPAQRQVENKGSFESL